MAHESNTSTLKTSLLINQQVPEFVREEHPLFISFLEAYYEFLENEQGSQNNDGTKISKDLRFVQDVDSSIGAFESNFLNTYANLVPKDAIADKSFLIKNILPVYLAKGNKKSFDFLFRLLYGQELDIRFPKDQILRASDGDFTIERVLRLRDSVSSFYIGDGITNIFNLAQPVSEDEIVVRINGDKQFSISDANTSAAFHTRKEERKIVFTNPPPVNADVRVEYNDFSESILTNRKVVGARSNASALVESSVPRLLESQRSIEAFLNRKTIKGTFSQGEQILTNIVDDKDNIIELSCNTTSSLEIISVISGGSGYNIGDPVLITAGGFEQKGSAEVSVVRSGFSDNANINFGGTGFKVSDLVVGRSGDAQSTFAVASVDSDIKAHQNTFTLSTTKIDEIDINQSLTSDDYGFLANVIAGSGTTGLSGIVLDSVSGNTTINPVTGGVGAKYEERIVSNTSNLQQFANSTIRPVFHYVSGNSYTGDIQLDEIYVGDGLTGNIANFTFEQVQVGLNEGTGTLGWQTSTANVNTYSDVAFTDMANTVTFTHGRWNMLIDRSPPSSNTGVTYDGTSEGSPVAVPPGGPPVAIQEIFIYAETSGVGHPNANFWFRGPFIQLGAQPSFRYKVARFGDSIGTLEVYFDVTSNALGGGENVSSRIVDCLQDRTITDLGPMTSLTFLTSNVSGNNIPFDSDGPFIEAEGERIIKIKPFRSLGRIKINDGGGNYSVGDEIIFSETTEGFGAAAAVSEIGANGAIVDIQFQPSRITGNGKVTAVLNEIIGTGTSFNTELLVGDKIILNNESRFINVVTNATHLTTNTNFTTNTGVNGSASGTDRKIGIHRKFPIGGTNYKPNVFPTIGVNSYSGSGFGANVEVIAAMADQEQVSATSNGTVGIVEEIRITEPGSGYRAVPSVDLSSSGDGQANATAVLQNSLREFDGRFTTSKGIISASERKLQGLDYYQDYIYVTNVPTEFEKYKSIFKGLVHPAGFKNYAEVDLTQPVETAIETSTLFANTLSGTVNVTSNSTFVIGTNTKFVTITNTAPIIGNGGAVIHSGNLINVGTQIVVNNEVRTVSSVVSNTNVVVSVAFTSNANTQSIIVLGNQFATGDNLSSNGANAYGTGGPSGGGY
tara:strand:- start:3868 stop:7245 length:3378 start_codon:yes stop_codon:yes gene_type:complete